MRTQDNDAGGRSRIEYQNEDTADMNSASFGGFNIWDIFRVLQGWWWLILSIVIVSLLLTGYVVSRMTPVYMASSILEIKQEDRKIFGQDSDAESFVADSEFFNTQIELLRSDTLAGNIIDQFNLISDPDFQIDETSREAKRLAAINLFSKKLKVAAVGRSRLIKVSFEHTSPSKAEKIANGVADSFVTYNLERKYNATSYARDFVEDRLKTTKDILEKSERQLVEYASANSLITVRDTQGNVSPGLLANQSLVALNVELLGARTRRLEEEEKYKIAQGNAALINVTDGVVLADLRRTHTALTSEYIEKGAIYVPEFPLMVELKSRIDYIAEQIETEGAFLQDKGLSTLKADYDIALSAEQDLQSRFNALKISFETIRDKSVEYNILKREVDTNRSQYDALLQRLKEVSIADDIGSNLISLVDRAVPPRNPFKPRLLLSLLVAGFLSSLIGTAIVFAIEFIDDRIKSPDHVKQKLGSVVMGVIPRDKSVGKISNALNDPTSAVAEAYSSLRTNLQFSGPDGGPKVIHITSTRSGEGKSVTSLGLALRFAGLGERVLLIDADMRLPTFKRGVDESIGLSGLLTSKEDVSANILMTKYENLDLLPSGANVPNPSEILSTYRLKEIIDHVRSNYAYVIVDSPPVMGLADAPILASSCDASLLIVEGASTRTPAVKATLERLYVSGVKVLGVVITKYTLQSKGYLNYYQYSYGEGATNYSAAGRGKKTKASVNKDYMDIMS